MSDDLSLRLVGEEGEDDAVLGDDEGGGDERTTALERVLYDLLWEEFPAGDLQEIVDGSVAGDMNVYDDPEVLALARRLADQVLDADDSPHHAGWGECFPAICEILAVLARRYGMEPGDGGLPPLPVVEQLAARLEAEED